MVWVRGVARLPRLDGILGARNRQSRYPGHGSVQFVPRAFTALEEPLGLKLEPARAPREFIVIDRVER